MTSYEIQISDYDGCTVDQRIIAASSRAEAEAAAREIREQSRGQFIYISESLKKPK